MSPRHPQNSLGRLCLRAQTRIPSRPERKKRPLYILPTHLWAVANRPLPCNVGGFGIPLSNKKGTIFRTGKPVPNSALLATNIASIGGAGVRHGEDGGDVFFARDGLGCDGVALLSSCVWCGAWMLCQAGRLQARATHGRDTLGLRSKPWQPLRLTHIEERTRLSHLDRTGLRCCCRKCARAWGFCRNCRNRVGTA